LAAAPGVAISIVAHCWEYPAEPHGLVFVLFVISRADAGGRVGFLPRDHARQKDAKPQEAASSLPNHLLRELLPLLRNDSHRSGRILSRDALI
jgi:hypothetical protein